MLPRLLIATLAATAAFASTAAASPVELVRSLNAARAHHDLAPLRTDTRLTRAATRHSRDMVAHHYYTAEFSS